MKRNFSARQLQRTHGPKHLVCHLSLSIHYGSRTASLVSMLKNQVEGNSQLTPMILLRTFIACSLRNGPSILSRHCACQPVLYALPPLLVYVAQVHGSFQLTQTLQHTFVPITMYEGLPLPVLYPLPQALPFVLLMIECTTTPTYLTLQPFLAISHYRFFASTTWFASSIRKCKESRFQQYLFVRATGKGASDSERATDSERARDCGRARDCERARNCEEAGERAQGGEREQKQRGSTLGGKEGSKNNDKSVGRRK